MLLSIIVATLVVSLVAILPIIFLVQKRYQLNTKNIIPFAAGVILAFSWLELIPEIFEHGHTHEASLVVLMTIAIMFLIESIFHWHHCQHGDCQRHTKSTKHLAVFNLVGDGIHNFVDGVVIASAFLVDFRLGIITTIAVIIHEIPQELADAGVLLYAGFSKKKVIAYNFLFGLTAILGAVLAFFFINSFEKLLPILLAVAAGNFIYIALSDLVPIIHHESEKNATKQIFWFILGGLIIYLLTFLSHGH